MDSNRRTLELLGQDLISTWGDLHDAAKAVRVNASDAYKLALELEGAIDTVYTQLLKTVADQLESDRQHEQVDQH